MFRHRLAVEADHYRLPIPPAPSIRPESFVLCTAAVIPGCTAEQWAGIQNLYEAALKQAKEDLRPSIVDRDVFGHWN